MLHHAHLAPIFGRAVAHDEPVLTLTLKGADLVLTAVDAADGRMPSGAKIGTSIFDLYGGDPRIGGVLDLVRSVYATGISQAVVRPWWAFSRRPFAGEYVLIDLHPTVNEHGRVDGVRVEIVPLNAPKPEPVPAPASLSEADAAALDEIRKAAREAVAEALRPAVRQMRDVLDRRALEAHRQCPPRLPRRRLA